MKRIFFVTAALFISLALGAQEKLTDSDLTELKNRMQGTFTSEAQSLSDTDYFNIQLKMVPIWSHQKDGYWLYVEQAVASAVKRPYRQRIYHVYQQDERTLVSKVYELHAPMRFAGAWSNPALLKDITKDSLVDRQGCAIYLQKNKDGDFAGATPGKECLSSLRGAAYATSEVVIYANKLSSWDRGWDNNDKQVWGAEKGGYEFVKQKE